MPKPNLRRSLIFVILAGLLVSPLALGAGPERGEPASAKCAAAGKIEAVRAALFARCISGSDEIAQRAGPGPHEPSAHAVAFELGCRLESRTEPPRHAVCRAAILPMIEKPGTGR